MGGGDDAWLAMRSSVVVARRKKRRARQTGAMLCAPAAVTAAALGVYSVILEPDTGGNREGRSREGRGGRRGVEGGGVV
ncbi:hypothetical protein E2C01_099065 [Portunus trituberculatus]|uniref:Uncharacterized protein n=1 Tax=Portunus trituberculatus TaxID=210409 RepID=A0A5B7KA06_PORTR|nr:hypothetical protein [Portunus trituberculatus]